MGEMDDVDAFARSNRRRRQIRLTILGLLCASPFLWLTYNCQKQRAQNEKWHEEARERNALSKEEQAELARLLPEIGKMIQTASKTFAEDVTPAKLAEAVPGDGRCGRDVERIGYVFVKPGEQPKAQQLTSAAQSLANLEERVKNAEDGATKYDLEHARDLASGIDDTVVLVGERTAPAMLGDSYIPGQVRGTAYVYSSSTRKIVCAGDISVENSAEIAFEYTTSRYDIAGTGNKRAAAQSKLEADLSDRTAKAITRELRQVR